MRHLGFALTFLVTFAVNVAHAEAQPTGRTRMVLMPRTQTIATELQTFLTTQMGPCENNPSQQCRKFHIVKTAQRNGIIRAFLVSGRRDDLTTAIQSHAVFGQSVNGTRNVRVRQDGRMKPALQARGLESGTHSSSSTSSSDERVQILPQWGTMRIQAHDPQPTRNTSANGTKVCVIDTGVGPHNRLAGRVIYEVNWSADICNVPEFFNDPYCYPDAPAGWAPPYELNTDLFDGTDDDGHGTHVAGIIGATAGPGIDMQGVYPQARFLSVKGLGWHWVPNYWYDPTDPYSEPFVYEYFGYDFDLALSVWDCMDQGAQVINMSFGSDSETDTVLHAAIKDAYNAGIILVAAAGNSSDIANGVLAGVGYPARYPQVIPVTALGVDGRIANFSSIGSVAKFTAPGVLILSTVLNDAFDYYSGTSMASPFVAGVAARMLANAPYASRDDLVGTKLGLSRLEEGEHGLINAELSCRR